MPTEDPIIRSLEGRVARLEASAEPYDLTEVRSELRRIEQAVCLRLDLIAGNQDRIENKLDRLLQGCYTE